MVPRNSMHPHVLEKNQHLGTTPVRYEIEQRIIYGVIFGGEKRFAFIFAQVGQVDNLQIDHLDPNLALQ